MRRSFAGGFGIFIGTVGGPFEDVFTMEPALFSLFGESSVLPSSGLNATPISAGSRRFSICGLGI